MSEHKSKGTEHGTLPSVKGPGYTAHDPHELCDTYDADGNGDDLCPSDAPCVHGEHGCHEPPTCAQGQHLTQADGHHAQTCVADPPKPQPEVPPTVVVAQPQPVPVTTTTTTSVPVTHTTAVVVPSGPELPNTGAMTAPAAGLGLTMVFLGAALFRWGRLTTARR
jgi:LPXTG-motif cell wall-anchored protein